ncbi:unnamed protein product [Cylicocyclus nassatus]|uniref:Uncharacterized protein n=1 Tax=Cylicocyclus nassatus TaxID=53992 RepID=A0AA36DSA7_CYLNA|nr:unnamed protein product [Cylicocyclus nassatus]
MMIIAAIIFLILSLGPTLTESDLCKKMDSDIIPAYYFDIGGRGCDTVYLSRKQIPLTYFEQGKDKCKIKPIAFRWGADIAIVTKKGNSYIFNIVPATALLDKQENKSGIVTLNLRYPRRIPKYAWYKIGHQNLATCHRVSNFFISCFSFDGSDVTQIMLQLLGRTVRTVNYKTLETNWTKAFKIDSIASYSTPKKENHLWIKHPLNWVYNVNLDELSKDKDQKLIVYNVEDWQEPSKSSNAELVFADDNMLETRRCKRDGSCSYDLHFPKQITKLRSFRLYESMKNLVPGMIIDHVEIPPITTTAPPSVDHREIYESEEWMYYHYIPIQILALITFIYLCFFFFYAFKPNPNSNLVELHAMMEEEYSRLSLLTDEVVKRMIAERQRPPTLLLKREPGLAPVPTDSTEMICCYGTTCESWLCPHCRVSDRNLAGSLKRTLSLPPSKRKSAELRLGDKWRTDSSRKRTKSVSRTTMPKQTFNTNAKSTATKSMNPQDAKMGKRPRPITVAPIKRGRPERESRALPVRLWKGGSSEMRRLTPEKVMKRMSSEIRRATPERVRKRGSSQLRRPSQEKHKAQAASLRAQRPAMVQMGGHI